jgi:hypothetical protein
MFEEIGREAPAPAENSFDYYTAAFEEGERLAGKGMINTAGQFVDQERTYEKGCDRPIAPLFKRIIGGLRKRKEMLKVIPEVK